MRKALITVLKYVVFLGLGVWIIYGMLHQLDDKQKVELGAAIGSVNLWYFIPIFIIGFFSHYFRAVRWRLLLETVDVKPSVINTLFAVFIGYLSNLFLFRTGEVVKCTVLARYEKAPVHKMVGTIVAERAWDMFCLLVITFGTFLLQAHIISSYATDLLHKAITMLEQKKMILVAAVVLMIIATIALIIIYRRNKETKVGHFIKEMSHGVLSIIRMRKRWQFLLHTVLIWLMYTLQIYLAFFSLPATAHLTFPAALVVLVFGSVGVIVTPGGIGAYVGLVQQILVYYSVSSIDAQAFGWIAWAGQAGILMVMGIISAILIIPYNRKRNAEIGVVTEQNL
jgi:glycosyltransferase 2 family protein